jgi:hypothetical protein
MLKVKEFLELRKELLNEAKKQFKFSECPLNPDNDNEYEELGHYGLSRIFTGLDKYEWECPFCGRTFST